MATAAECPPGWEEVPKSVQRLSWVVSSSMLGDPAGTCLRAGRDGHSNAFPAMARTTTTPRARTADTPARARAAKRRRTAERSDVLVSAVISTYLLTHLHHVLQRAEFGAEQEGRESLAANYAQLRKVLCLDARSMEDASASGTDDDQRANAA